jgi:hypothetical protein
MIRITRDAHRPEGFVLELSDEGYSLMLGVLNEAVNGVRVEYPSDVRDRLHELYELLQTNQGTHLRLDSAALGAFATACRVVLQELGPEEFGTRVGVSWRDANAMLSGILARNWVA